VALRLQGARQRLPDRRVVLDQEERGHAAGSVPCG
jgi:hypothetical protein